MNKKNLQNNLKVAKMTSFDYIFQEINYFTKFLFQLNLCLYYFILDSKSKLRKEFCLDQVLAPQNPLTLLYSMLEICCGAFFKHTFNFRFQINEILFSFLAHSTKVIVVVEIQVGFMLRMDVQQCIMAIECKISR